VYVLETNGTLDYISITSSSGSDTLLPSTVSTPGATYMVYDGNKNKLYIPWLNQSVSPAQGELTIVDVSQSVPQQLATIVIPAFTSPGISGSVPAIASAVTVLPDESQAYVGSYAMLPPTSASLPSRERVYGHLRVYADVRPNPDPRHVDYRDGNGRTQRGRFRWNIYR